MAEHGGVVAGILGGGEHEEKHAEAMAAPADDMATAVMMDAARFDPDLSKEAKEYLRKQGVLVDHQLHHFDEEHRLSIGAAKRKRFSDHLRISFQMFLALLGAGIGIGAIIMTHDAFTSRSVVIDSFETPHALAERGITGKTVATGLLDVLTRIQAASRAQVERRALSNAWTSDIAIEVPETGLSIGQIERVLKARFGHDQHIDGDLVQTEEGGFALTVRGNGILAKTFSDDKRNLEKLLTAAGEYVYSKSQPGLWTAYLSNNERGDDAIHFAEAAYASVSVSEKPYVLNYWANSIANRGDKGAMRQALPLYQEALRLKPDYWPGYNNVMNALNGLGDEEGVVRVGKQMIQAAGGSPGRAPESMFQNYYERVWNLTGMRAGLIVDIESHGGVGSNSSFSGAANLNIARVEALLHDLETAQMRLKTTPVDEKNAPDVSLATMDRALIAEERGDWKAAAKEWDGFAIAFANPTVSTGNPSYMCFAAVAFEKTGQPAKADAAIDGPMREVGIGSFVKCADAKADVLALRGDWSGAQAWYAKAVKLSPSSPESYYAWGNALARQGDLDGAAAKFKEANQKGPNWADPLKAWGDVLVKQGRNAGALDMYDAALKFAPNWTQLKQARAAAQAVR
ncbi:MAG: tetratricopeptide repeat protein [Pseudomonadota bacterium]